jgi:hypothetical protein
MDGSYPPAVMVTLSDCTDTAREADYNRWCEETLIPHLELLPFVSKVKRFVNVFSDKPTFQGHPRYLIVSEVMREDLKQAQAEIRGHVAGLIDQGRGFDAVINMIDNLYGRTGPELRTERTGRPVTGIYLVLSYPIDSTRDAEFNEWYDEKHGPEGLALGIWDTCYRYRIADPNDPPHQVPYLTLYEPSRDALEARLAWNPAFIRKQNENDPVWRDVLGSIITGAFRQTYPALKQSVGAR